MLGGVAGLEAREVYILMDRINSPIQDGVLLPNNSHNYTEAPITSELGVFGVFMRLG